MGREILISQDATEKQVAILENNKLDEYYIERADDYRMFGNIYKGIVKTVIPGMGAAFVDLGTEKDGFLYVDDALRSPFDLDTEFEDKNGSEASEKEEPAPQQPPQRHRHHPSRRPRSQNIQEVLKVGQEVIVQVVKEPIGNKGPRLTTHFSIPARYLVMMPGEGKVGVSRRIEDRKERDRIRQILRKMELHKGVGFIVRTAGEGQSEKEYSRDVRYLLRLWRRIHGMISRKKAPSIIHQELSLVERVIRDHLTPETDRIVVDHRDMLRKVKRFVGLYTPSNEIKVELYDKGDLFGHFNIEKEIERAFQKTVMLKSGGHIVIEQTEGLVAIDVNTGKFTGRHNLEDTVFKTNMDAAWEVSRQLRLRDMGGIIVIDFIDMERHDHRRQLYRTFREALRGDRAKINVLPMSELGLVEMTRQRLRPSLESAVYDSCPYCKGKGLVKSSSTMAIQTIKELRKALGSTLGRVINVYLHPEVSSKLLSQEAKALHQLERNSRSRIFVFSEPTVHMEDIKITFLK